jgi:hypothetical protein
MLTSIDSTLDVMQVCRNGHVVTDRLRSHPESGRTHCERCGAPTLDSCPTCGQALPGAGQTDGLVPIGLSPAPGHCLECGAEFPWSRRPRATSPKLVLLEALLRRLPLAIRQFRWRQLDKTPFRVEEERDLEDLLRALLPLHFDDVRLEGRTPRYSTCNRTDLFLVREQIALTVKIVRAGMRDAQLTEQLNEDVAYYRGRGGCRTLVMVVYDPEGLLPDWKTLEGVWSQADDCLDVRAVVCGISTPAGLPGR